MTAAILAALLLAAYAIEQRRLRGAAERKAERLAGEVTRLAAARDAANRAAFDRMGRTR